MVPSQTTISDRHPANDMHNAENLPLCYPATECYRSYRRVGLYSGRCKSALSQNKHRLLFCEHRIDAKQHTLTWPYN